VFCDIVIPTIQGKKENKSNVCYYLETQHVDAISRMLLAMMAVVSSELVTPSRNGNMILFYLRPISEELSVFIHFWRNIIMLLTS